MSHDADSNGLPTKPVKHRILSFGFGKLQPHYKLSSVREASAAPKIKFSFGRAWLQPRRKPPIKNGALEDAEKSVLLKVRHGILPRQFGEL